MREKRVKFFIDKDFLRYVRQVLDMTQDEFALAVGYSKIYISYIEMGRRELTERFEQKVIDVFGLTEDELIQYKMQFGLSKQRKERLLGGR